MFKIIHQWVVVYTYYVRCHKLVQKGFIIIGNESKGVSNSIINLSTHKISIQRKGQAESLNAAIATGIICHSLLS